MINNRTNVSRFQGTPPTDDKSERDRKIAHGPLYPASEVLTLVEQEALSFWTKGSSRDSQKWKLDAQDVGYLIKAALTNGRFLSAEWCEQKPAGPWAACDAYVVTRQEWNEAAHKYLACTYYVKYAISKTGKILLMASNHPEGA